MSHWLPIGVALPLLAATVAAQEAVVDSTLIYERAPFASAHASTIVETDRGLVAAWFGGTAEGETDVGIWSSVHDGTRWSAPVEVAAGVAADGTRYPTWNPVLVQPAGGPLLLFYKVGPSPRAWWGLVRLSHDRGRTWSPAARLPDGILGPIRAKPVELDGTLLAGSSTEHDGWIAHIERFTPPRNGTWDLAALASPDRWRRSAPLNDAATFGAIQPTLLVHTPARVQALCRSRQGVITESWSSDGGDTWSSMTATALPNPSAGIDALRLDDGRFLLVSNPTARGRRELAVALSDDGLTWRPGPRLEDAAEGEYSYPAAIQTTDGMIHITYTWRRERIKHVILDPRRLEP